MFIAPDFVETDRRSVFQRRFQPLRVAFVNSIGPRSGVSWRIHPRGWIWPAVWRFDLSVPNPRANVSILFPSITVAKTRRVGLKGGRWLFEKLEYRGFSLADVSSRIVRDTGEMLRTLRNKGDGQVSGKFNLFHKLASRGSLRLNPEKLYRSTVYESFHPTSAPSFPSDYRSVIVARLLETENFETTPTAQGVKRKRWYRNEKKEKRESISRLVARFVKERK